MRWVNHLVDDEVFAPASPNVLLKVLPAILVDQQQSPNVWEAISLDVTDGYWTVDQEVPTVVY